ncbi:putative FAD-dependent oxidase [Xylona heveae TC161]|uniref:Putative FAD-dependent oxidase n=1 Tax=Xylona heveae (strain CBS 132557 / TC161) TaxID=1328760 RepID=A0A165HQR1_XYLHT|nr:putative FAD-dependent oxidase [Xylona heveae TC161]KZF23843.1 putative FAD-dependent oxidase [Xylona heveae TC161]
MHSFTSWLLVLGCALHLHIVSALVPSANLSSVLSSLHLNLSPATEIFDPNETQRWTTHDAPTYVVGVRPATEVDVQNLVVFAALHRIPFLATGGAHGFTTSYGALHNGILLDLSQFRTVSVDADANTMTIGAGVRFGDVYEPLYNAGKEITTGTSSCVGMLGATLGGGVGRYNGIHGMILDALISVRLITAAGEVVTASTMENSDLFWAVRGAGFNYGIVIEATYRVTDLTSQLVANADFNFPLNASTAIMSYLKSLETEMPEKLSLIALVSYVAEYGGLTFTLNAAYPGPKEELVQLLNPLLDKIAPLRQNISVVPWKDLTYAGFFAAEPSMAACVKGLYRNVYGGSVQSYNISSFDSFFHDMQGFYSKYPDAQSSVFFIEQFSRNKTMSFSAGSTAYPYRDITAHLLWNFGYPAGSLEDTVNEFAVSARASLQASSGFSPQQIYVNYGHGDESPDVLYGAHKLPKLRSLKQLWDPENVFRFNHPLV